MDLFEDGIGGCGPDEGTGFGVIAIDEAFDLVDELFDVGEGSTADRFLSDDAEPAFDLIEPRRIGRCVVNVIARPPRQPGFHFGVFVGGVVVDDEMHVELSGHVGFDVAQERKELLMAMPAFTLRHDGAGRHVERSK